MSTININRNRVLVWSLVAAMGLACSQIATTQVNGSKTKPKPAAKPVVTQYYNGIPISEKPDKVVHDLYTAMDGSTVRIIGIASITEKKIVGWDCDGNLSKEVVDLFTKTLTRSRGSSPTTLTFVFGKKNRYVLVEQKDKGTQPLPIVTPYMPLQMRPYFAMEMDRSIDTVLLPSDDSATEGFIEIFDTTYPPKKFDFAWPIKVNDLDRSKSFQIAEIKAFKSKDELTAEAKNSNEIRMLSSMYRPTALDHGLQMVTVAAKGEAPKTGCSLYLLGPNGDELMMVDSKGALLSRSNEQTWSPDNPFVDTADGLTRISRATHTGTDHLLASILIPTLKTENVKTLQLRLATKFQVRFDHLPLDPK